MEIQEKQTWLDNSRSGRRESERKYKKRRQRNI